MIFATGNIYRETGTASREVEDKHYSEKIKSEKEFSRKGKLQVLRNDKQKTSRSTVEVELKDHKTRDRKASRNSWVDIYNETTALRKHKGYWGRRLRQQWAGVACQLGSTRGGDGMVSCMICWFAEQGIAAIVFGALTLIFTGLIYYKNVSFVIMKRLLRESNVVMILVFGLCLWSIDIARPYNVLSPVNGLLYMLAVSAFLFLDALKAKSRVIL